MTLEFLRADCLEWMRGQPDQRFDLVFGSPPYVDARLYLEDGQDLGVSRNCFQWVEWMLQVTIEAHRISRGPVIWVAAGVTRDRNYWPACEGLAWEWHRLGGDHTMYRPCVFHRVGIPGSGGDQWFRSDWEFILCFKHAGPLPWSDNTACGHPPKWAPGGEMSYRNSEGTRRNQWGHSGGGRKGSRTASGERQNAERPSHVVSTTREVKVRETYREGGRAISVGIGDGRQEQQQYVEPSLANPGNVLHFNVGGGLMGDNRCHENEAPFPEKLAEFFVLSCCPPGGLVLDPFSGSGTTAAVCQAHGRNCIGVDLRQSQVDLGRRRCSEIQRMLI